MPLKALFLVYLPKYYLRHINIIKFEKKNNVCEKRNTIEAINMRGSRNFSPEGAGWGGGPKSQEGSDGKFQHGKN